MQISEFFNIFDLSHPMMNKVSYFVSCHDYSNAKKELLKYFLQLKELMVCKGEEISERDKNFSLAYISRHNILSGPNEADLYLSSMFLSVGDDYTSMDVMPFINKDLSFMIMSRQKEKECAFFYSPNSIFPPYITLTDNEGCEKKVFPSKYAYVSTTSPDEPLYEEDIYAICEESDSPDEPYGSTTGRVYMAFDLSKVDLSTVKAARFCAKITLDESITKKELLFFNIADSSWDKFITWNSIKGNVYSWESSPEGPTWESPAGSDSEYLNVTCRFWFARPMAYQYLADTEKNSVYGEKLLFLMDAFSKKKDGGFNRVLETGERLSNFTSVLHALVDTPVMTPDYLVSILWMMYRDMKHLIENSDLGWSNWAVVRTSGLSKAIDFLPELKDHEEWKNQTRDVLTSLFDKMYSPDFSFREAGLAYSFWCMDLFAGAYKSSVINNDPYSTFMKSRLEKAFDASLDLIYPNFYDTNVGDSNYVSKLDYLKKTGINFPTKKLKAFVSGVDDPSVPTSTCYPYSGSVIMRNSFNKEKGIYLALHSNPFDGHAHNDIGNVILYAHGRPLLTDNGRYGYSQSRISSYLKNEESHNIVQIENAKYTSHSESDAEIVTFASNSFFDAVESVAKPYKDIGAVHKRRVLFLKKEGFLIVSDYITTNEDVNKFIQHWNFMPHSKACADYNNVVSTNFAEGCNVKLLCPDAVSAEIKNGIFSPGYGMAEKSKKAAFVKFGKDVSLTTLIIPFNSKDVEVSAQSVTPDDLSQSSITFDIDGLKGCFFAKNEDNTKFSDFTFDGDMALNMGDRFFLVNGSRFTALSKVIIESKTPIPDMHVKISGGIVEIDSSSVKPCTQREEAIRIYSPKTTHVLLNGEPIPFTLYSDYVYAVTVK